jgi:hypothetical protein
VRLKVLRIQTSHGGRGGHSVTALARKHWLRCLLMISALTQRWWWSRNNRN